MSDTLLLKNGGKQMKSRLNLVMSFFLPFSLTFISSCSCSQSQEMALFNKYGKKNAFDVASNGQIYKLENKDITFFHNVNRNNCFFYNEVQEAFTKVHNLQYVNINFEYANNLNPYAFTFIVLNDFIEHNTGILGHADRYVRNPYVGDNGKIRGTKIRISSYAFRYNNLKSDEIMCVLLHEFGHVLGLGHITAKELENNTVMKQGKYKLREFQKFDLANIEWAYK